MRSHLVQEVLAWTWVALESLHEALDLHARR